VEPTAIELVNALSEGTSTAATLSRLRGNVRFLLNNEGVHGIGELLAHAEQRGVETGRAEARAEADAEAVAAQSAQPTPAGVERAPAPPVPAPGSIEASRAAFMELAGAQFDALLRARDAA
jgi:hypothetical protein